MNEKTRNQLLALSEAFYRAHAEAFDASRGHHAWPGWKRILDWLPASTSLMPKPTHTEPKSLLRVLDIGCGNARLARFLTDAGFALQYLGVDANAELLTAAQERLRESRDGEFEFIQQDFLASDTPGSKLPEGPFDLIAIMGVLHHIPGRDWRLHLLRAAADRLRSGGILALATWQFAGRSRFARRTVEWASLDPILGERIDLTHLENGDHLLRFGDDTDAPPRYCHQVADTEFAAWPQELRLEALAEFRADGAEGDLNRYWLLKRASTRCSPELAGTENSIVEQEKILHSTHRGNLTSDRVHSTSILHFKRNIADEMTGYD